MKVRKILNGDYCLGHGNQEFLADSAEAIAQNVMTRLSLWQGSWFLDERSGTPWLQSILGRHEAVDAIIASRIATTDGVNSVTQIETVLDPDKRTLSVTATIDTDYGSVTLSEGLNVN